MRAVIQSRLVHLMENRGLIVRFVIGAWMAHFFGSWIEHLPQTHAIFFEIRPVPLLILQFTCWLGFLVAAGYAFGVQTRALALVLLLLFNCIYLQYFWFKELPWSFIGILLIQILYGDKNARFSTVYWRTPFLLAIYAGFTISGLSKLFYPGWYNGDVMLDVLTVHPVGPGWPREFVDLLPYRFIGYFTLATEILSLPLVLWKRTRLTGWWINTILHFGILCWWRIGPVALCTLTAQLLLYPGRDRDLLAEPASLPKS
jgi:hypothetical protein